jgi:isoleucyl-tRNA synthetase/very-short-patch-repair endonuclease
MSEATATVTTHYPSVEPNPDFAKQEKQILADWQQKNVFKQSLAQRAEAEEYVFYDGPPFANGLPHYGHLLTGYVKDLYARYHTMKGERVERRFGWDCHGLPAEMGAEKDLKISGRQQIQDYGIGKFNEYCRSSVMKYAGEWEHYVTRQARWVDFAGDYKTMDRDYMESVLWAFKQLYDKGYIYESHRVMPYSWAAETPLSNFETKLDNSYRQRVDKAVTVAFELDAETIASKLGLSKTYASYKVLAWTTTPWTLPSNLALAVGKDLEYSLLEGKNSLYIVAAFAAQKISELLELTVIGTKKGIDLVANGRTTYQPLFPYFAEQKNVNAFQLIIGDFITEGEGTGVVHLAPGFGEDDQRVCAANGIAVVVPVDESGRYTEELFDIPMTHSPLAGEYNAPLRVGGGKSDFSTEKAQEMRKNPTDAERKLWDMLRDKQSGVKFRRQQPIGNYIADFYCAEKRLILEIDGSQHADNQADALRAAWLEAQGLRVHRFWNNEVLQNPDGVYTKIQELLIASPPHAVSSETAAPPQGGSDRLHLAGLHVIWDEATKHKNTGNEAVIKYLKANHLLVKEESYAHNYPHCWRTNTPLIYRALPSWYVAVTKFRDRAVELNKTINWIPDHIRDGQMGHMLATAPDWSISRNRFWGTPIPIWRTESGGIKVFGSIAELEEFFGQKVEDLHRPFIDNLTKTDENGEVWQRVTDVFDCWFESGSMPFAQVHYPFENKEWFETHFPADFITEYVGQTRGWFNTLIILATALFDKAPFKNCICHGIILDDHRDEQGKPAPRKLSKSLKNYPDPLGVFDQYGADALRWFMLSSAVMTGQNLQIDAEGKFIRDVVRLHIKPIWNAYNFFTLYANADGVKAELDTTSENLMDRYILAKCREAVVAIDAGLTAYDTPAAYAAVSSFFEVLNNWYIRRNKDRFWNEDGATTDQAAYNTLYTVLVTMCQAAAPLLPMTLEAVYQGLVGHCDSPPACGGGKGGVSLQDKNSSALTPPPQPSPASGRGSYSVHLCDFPDVSGFHGYEGISKDGSVMPVSNMDRVRAICNASLSVRNRENVRIRQPLSKLIIYNAFDSDSSNWAALSNNDSYPAIIQDELNVKMVEFSSALNDVAKKNLIINARIVGKRLGQKTKDIIAASKKGEWEVLEYDEAYHFPSKARVGEELLFNSYNTDEDGNVQYEFEIKLEPKAGIKGAVALSTNDALVVLDLEIMPELELEGYSRDFIRMVQQARKDSALQVSDRIELLYQATGKIGAAIQTHSADIASQVLATALAAGDATTLPHHFTQELEGESVVFGFRVKTSEHSIRSA